MSVNYGPKRTEQPFNEVVFDEIVEDALVVGSLSIAGPEPWVDFNHPAIGGKFDGVTLDDAAWVAGFARLAALPTASVLRLPAGKSVVSAAVAMPQLVGKAILGPSRSDCIIEQQTDNVPVMQTTRENTADMTLEGFTLTYKNVQPAANTNAFALMFTSTLGAGVGDGWYQWHVERLGFSKAQTAMGIAGAAQGASGSLPVWACEFSDLTFQAISSQLIFFVSPVVIGMPLNIIRKLLAINAGVPMGNTYAFTFSACEVSADTWDIEDWGDKFVNVSGNTGFNLKGLHIERWVFNTGGNAFLFQNAGGFTIEGVTVSGTVNATPGLTLFHCSSANANARISGVTTNLTITTPANFTPASCNGGAPTARLWVKGWALVSGTAYTFPSTNPVHRTGVVWDNNSLTAISQARIVLVYGAAIATDASAGNEFDITPTDGVAFTISNPTNLFEGQKLTYTIRNTTAGALGAATWGANFRLAAWVNPAAGFSRSITYRFDATRALLDEISRTPADVPN